MTKINRMFSLVCFEGEGTEGEPSGNQTPPQFTQDDLNKFLAEDRRKHQEKYKQLETSYQGLMQTKGLAEDEKQKLRVEFEDLQKTFRTKEQQMEFEKKQSTLKYESELTEWKQKAVRWEGAYKDQVVQTSLQDAAISGEAFNPNQIIGLLQPITELRPDIDKEGKETGRLVPMIDFPDIDEKTGESIKTLRSPKDAVKRMKELPQLYGNLFKSNVVSGVGAGTAAGNVAGNGRVDASKLTPEQYRKIRQDNPELLGLKRRGSK